jgi:hypothetical protein
MNVATVAEKGLSCRDAIADLSYTLQFETRRFAGRGLYNNPGTGSSPVGPASLTVRESPAGRRRGNGTVNGTKDKTKDKTRDEIGNRATGAH